MPRNIILVIITHPTSPSSLARLLIYSTENDAALSKIFYRLAYTDSPHLTTSHVLCLISSNTLILHSHLAGHQSAPLLGTIVDEETKEHQDGPGPEYVVEDDVGRIEQLRVPQ